MEERGYINIMGLDSYLHRRGKTIGGKIIMGLKEAEYGEEDLGYWRKN